MLGPPNENAWSMRANPCYRKPCLPQYSRRRKYVKYAIVTGTVSEYKSKTAFRYRVIV